MKHEHRFSLAAVYLVLPLAAACGGSSSTSNGTTGGTMATGGTIGSGGMLGAGGTVATGGTELTGGTTTVDAATGSGWIPGVGGTVGSGGVSTASDVPPGNGGGGGTSAGASGSTSGDAGATTSVDAPAAADAGAGADANSGPASIVDASGDNGGATPGGIVSFTRGGESLEVFAVPGQVLLFLRPEATSTDITPLIEGADGVRLATASSGNRHLVQVPVGLEGRYIATVTADPRVLDASPNVISSDLAATVLEGGQCDSPHALNVIEAFKAGSNSDEVACRPVDAGYMDFPLLRLTVYLEYDVDTIIADELGAGDAPRYLNMSVGPVAKAIESHLAKVDRDNCFQASESDHPCFARAQTIEAVGFRLAWMDRLHVLATYCGSSALDNKCHAVLAMAAGNDSVPLDDVLASIRVAGVANVLSSNATIVGTTPDWSNYVSGKDSDFVIGANSFAVTGAPNTGPGTSFASPFVLGLTFRKANQLRDPNDPDLAAVADAEALCMVKKAAANRGKLGLGDRDYDKISERCCLNRPASERDQDEKVHCCRPGQTWNPNAQPPACECSTEAGGPCDGGVPDAESALDAGVCPVREALDPTGGKCWAVYSGTMTQCATDCTPCDFCSGGSLCGAPVCVTQPTAFGVSDAGDVDIWPRGQMQSVSSQLNNGAFTLRVGLVTGLQTMTTVYSGTVDGETMSGTIAGNGTTILGDVLTETGTFTATQIDPSASP